MSLVGETCVFELKVKGESTRKVYKGNFVMRLFLSLKERTQVAVEFSKRDKGNEKDPFQSGIVQMICELRNLADQAPDWFKSEDVWDAKDIQPFLTIREEHDKAVEEYLKLQEE
jgi:hypothetical protein